MGVLTKTSVVQKILIVTMILVVVFAIGGGGYWFFQQQGESSGEQNRTIASETETKEETKQLLAKIGELILLPNDEDPTIATITDVETLKQEQVFFKNAKEGDVLVMYPQKSKAILYNPTENVIVNVGKVYIEDSAEETEPVDEEQEPLTLEIRNGTEQKGLAGDLRDEITKNEYYDVIDVADATRGDYEEIILVDTGVDESKKTLLQVLRDELDAQIVEDMPEGEEDTEAEVLLIIGQSGS